MNGKWIRLWIWLWLWLLVACAQEEATVTPTPTLLPTATQITTSAVIPTATPAPTATATPTPTPTATPIAPLLTVGSQTLGENGRLSISRVDTPVDGWVVILAAQADGSEQVLGQTAVSAGSSEAIIVTIDPLAAQPTLAARLHQESSDNGRFDFPDADPPLLTAVAFTVDIELPSPVITIPEQTIGSDGVLQVDLIFSPVAGWLQIHADDSGEAGTAVGVARLAEGRNENLQILLRWREATPQLHAILYEDSVEPGTLNPPEEDVPLLVNGEPVAQPFRVALPPDVIVYDQPIIDGQLLVSRALSSGPGWLVVHTDDDGDPGLIIGFAALTDGVNEQVIVDLGLTAVSDQLYIRLHHDDNPRDTFDFPEADKPVLIDNQVPPPFTFNTNPGNYLITQDQNPQPDENGQLQIIIPIVVTDLESWLVIYSSQDGQRDQILAQITLPAGLNANIPLTLPADSLTDPLIAVLHLDADPIGTFDFPDGNDVPLRRNRTIIESPLYLQTTE